MSNLDFGDIVLGGNVFGWTADKDQSFTLLDAFLDAGGKSVDTADVYSAWIDGNSGGESETIIGEWFASRGNRDKVVLGTKVFQHPQRPGLRPENIRAALDDSLRRLQTDHVDLYYAHRDDPDVPQEEYLGAFDELVRAGKVREIGATTFTADRLRSATRIAQEQGLTPVTVSQDHYNLVERGIEKDVLPAVEELGLVELPYWSLASGFLTGKYQTQEDLAGADRESMAEGYFSEDGLKTVRTVMDIAGAHDVPASTIALAWLLAKGVTAPIASARNEEQLTALMAAPSVQLSEEEVRRLDDASSPFA